MNYFEDELRKMLTYELESGELRKIDDSTPIFSALMKSYPVSGSKIAWSKVQNSIERAETNLSIQSTSFIEFFVEMNEKFDLSGLVVYAGDSAIDFALEGSVDIMLRSLPKLLEVPQHHYFVGPGFSWCICLTMEGDMAFGLSNNSKL